MLRTVKADFKGKEVKLMCEHWANFPPQAAVLLLQEQHKNKTPEKLFSEGLIPYSEVTKYKAWEKHCGLFKMDPETCLKCPLVRLLYLKNKQVWVSHLDGSTARPFVPYVVTETRVGLNR